LPRIAAEIEDAKMGSDGRNAARITTTLSRGQKLALEQLANARGVKVAWLVRRAVERLLEESAAGTTLPLDLDGGHDVKR
jgi:hypothetical protein